MQIRVTLLRGGAARNILIRADATATATDVANAILSEGLSEPFQSSEGRPTLRVQDPLGRARVLAADAAVSESGVQSGGVIEVVREQQGAVDEIGAVLRVVAGPDAGAQPHTMHRRVLRCPCRWHRTAPVPGTISGIVAVPGIRHHPAQ